tara:strand:- start:80 stop:835 length:756 start_codon:yes stop_codon:yes gene_type:complete
MTKNYFATGIISKSSNFGEADSIFHLITKEYGLVKAVAKSVRKPKSKLKGHLQTLNHVNAYLRKGKNLDLIIQVESVTTFKSIKKNLNFIAQACYMTELTESVISEDQPSPELFNLLVSSLKFLETSKNRILLIHCFEFQLLALSGFKLMFLECVNCQKEISKNSHVFSPAQGGVLCPNCKKSENTKLINLSFTTLKILRNMSRENFSLLLEISPPKNIINELSRIFNESIKELLGIKLNSQNFYQTIMKH